MIAVLRDKHCREAGRWPASLSLCVLLLTLIALPAAAQERRVPATRPEIELSFAPLVKRVAPAVVNIYAKRVVRQAQSPLFDDPVFRRLFGDGLPPRERIQNSLGSGVIVQPEGLVVTAHHVIEGATEIKVALHDRREFDATVVRDDTRTDLAILRIDAGSERLPFLELRDSDDAEVGDLVLAIGNPFGVGQTVTSGIVSALARTAIGKSDFSYFIQTDAAINPGNSGGALVTMDGRLLGINTAIYSRTGTSAGVGFAVPSNMVATVLQGAVSGGRVVRPWFGASGQSMTSELAASLHTARPAGVLIDDVHPGGPAENAGLKPGDIVTAVNGREVDDMDALRFRIATQPVGGTAKLQVMRAGREFALSLPLQRAPELPPREATKLAGGNPLAGATVANLSPALAEELSLSDALRGVIVTAVDRGSLAGRTGLRPGDMILAVNGTETKSVAALKTRLAATSGRWQIAIQRGDRVMSVVIEG
jgi:serine protease Do